MYRDHAKMKYNIRKTLPAPCGSPSSGKGSGMDSKVDLYYQGRAIAQNGQYNIGTGNMAVHDNLSKGFNERLDIYD